MKKTSKLLMTLAVLAVTVIVAAFILFSNKGKEEVINSTVPDSIPSIKDEYKPYQEEYDTNHLINEDYIGMIRFDSGLIDLPFVKATIKDLEDYPIYDRNGEQITDYSEGCYGGPCTFYEVYMFTDWTTGEYSKKGTLFLDPRNTLSDQNLIMYGLHFSPKLDPEGTVQFTPLEKLLDKQGYLKNKTLKLYVDNQIREYEIAAVYILDNSEDSDDYENLQYQRTDYNQSMYYEEDAGYEKLYFERVNDAKLYDTDIELQEGDRTLTLQTGITGEPLKNQIVVCKETNVITFTD